MKSFDKKAEKEYERQGLERKWLKDKKFERGGG